MTFDPHKNLTITYNFLNLPQAINGTMVVYDATGRKLRLGSGATARETFNGIDFVGGKLEGILHDKGRLAPEPDEFNVSIGRLRSEYWRQDHLGNTRVAFSDQNENGIIETRDNPATPENEVEIMQENHYYPFGMNHKGRWYGPEAPENRRTYNGKEYTDELGLDWYDYGARWYDAALGRWWQVDPMAEEDVAISSYAYVRNNPLILIDKDGMKWINPYENQQGYEAEAAEVAAILKVLRDNDEELYSYIENLKITVTNADGTTSTHDVGVNVLLSDASAGDKGQVAEVSTEPSAKQGVVDGNTVDVPITRRRAGFEQFTGVRIGFNIVLYSPMGIHSKDQFLANEAGDIMFYFNEFTTWRKEKNEGIPYGESSGQKYSHAVEAAYEMRKNASPEEKVRLAAIKLYPLLFGRTIYSNDGSIKLH